MNEYDMDYRLDIMSDVRDLETLVNFYFEKPRDVDFLTFLFEGHADDYNGHYEKFKYIFPTISIHDYLADFIIDNEENFKEFIEDFLYEFQIVIDDEEFAKINRQNFGSFIYNLLEKTTKE